MPKYNTNIAYPISIEKSPNLVMRSGQIFSANREIDARIPHASIIYANYLFQKETTVFVSINPFSSALSGSS